MSAAKPDHPQHPRRPRLALLAVALTALACLAALLFRTPLRARYWAWRVANSSDIAERAVYLGGLCNAGEQARWGVAALLGDEESDVRQCGVLVLQHMRSEWAGARLVELLGDSDDDVRRLAALGLAFRGDDAVVPTLKWLYQTGDADSAIAACLAFERLGTHEAVSALNELAGQSADVPRRAALVDALDGIGEARCVSGLLTLLRDHRACESPRREEQIIERLLGGLNAAGYALDVTPGPASRPTESPPGKAVAERADAGATSRRAGEGSIAERAAAALARITGLSPSFSSDGPADERASAEETWQAWLAEHSQR